MDQKYPKAEKLKSKRTIDLLFTKGKSVAKYPLRLVYVPIESDESQIKFGVSVSKKYFKKAVDRNYFKRLLREAYRLNKHLLTDDMQQKFAFMMLYQSKDRLDFDEIKNLAIQLFEKFRAEIKPKDN